MNWVDPDGLAPVDMNGNMIPGHFDESGWVSDGSGVPCGSKSSQERLKQEMLDMALMFGPTIMTGGMIPPFGELPGLKSPLTGYTSHGLNQAVGRNGGRGVNVKAILDAVRNPKKIIKQANGTTKYVGKKATVILNKEGKVVTTYGKSRGPQIWDQGTTRPSGSGSAQRRANEQGFSYRPGAIY